MFPLEGLKYEKIANMVAMGVSNVDIAEAMGLSEGRICQIKDEEGFKKVLQGKMEERLKEQQDFNSGWDSIERQAQQIIIATLKSNRNPDFALRAAMTANRANRRGPSQGNEPLGAKTAGRVVINLNAKFVDKLSTLKPVEGNGVRESIERAPQQQKRVDVLPPGQVKSLLMDVKENGDVITDIDLGDFSLA